MRAPGATWLEHLDSPECWRLVASRQMGRVGVLVDSAPEIYPVNHAVDGETVVFRTDEGTKLRGLERSPSVCFQVDHTDATDSAGWSVLIKGRAVEVVDADETRALNALSIGLWASGDKTHWIRVVPSEITGRRLGHSEAGRRWETNDTGLDPTRLAGRDGVRQT